MLPSQFADIYSRQLVHTKIRLLLEKHGNQHIHCLSSRLHLSTICFNCQFLNHDHHSLAKIGCSDKPKSLLPIVGHKQHKRNASGSKLFMKLKKIIFVCPDIENVFLADACISYN